MLSRSRVLWLPTCGVCHAIKFTTIYFQTCCSCANLSEMLGSFLAFRSLIRTAGQNYLIKAVGYSFRVWVEALAFGLGAKSLRWGFETKIRD